MLHARRARSPALSRLLGALLLALPACTVPGPAARSVTIGEDIVVELRFEDPVAIAIETQAADGRSWVPFTYLTMQGGPEQVTVVREASPTDVRLTIGIGGKLVEHESGKVVADGRTSTSQNPKEHQLDVQGARVATQLQLARGTIATVRLDGANTSTTTRAFRK